MTEILQLDDIMNINLCKESHKRLILVILLFILYLYILPYNYDYTPIFLGTIISYHMYCVYSAKKTGEKTIMLKYKNIHIHHWMYFTVFLVLACNRHEPNSILIGLFFGPICHGIQYKDWDQIYYKNY